VKRTAREAVFAAKAPPMKRFRLLNVTV